MINLLPGTTKKEMAAARSNTLLLRYAILLVFAILFLFASAGFTFVYLSNSLTQAETSKRDNESRVKDYAETQAEASTLRANIASAKQLFDSELQYSKALARLSNLLPEGTALSSIDFDKQSFGTPKVLLVQITGEAAAERLKASFQSSPYISGATLGNLATTEDSAYPYTIELTVTINKSIAQ